jgi:signal-transduction protein with cAMP-binding, CBS, and nucleotidyltransferase domain
VSPGIVEGLLVARGRHVHQEPRLIVVEAVVCYLLGKDCFVTVVENYDSGEIFVLVRNFKQMKRLRSVSVFVGGDSIMFTHVDRLNAICQPTDMSPLGKMRSFRH